MLTFGACKVEPPGQTVVDNSTLANTNLGGPSKAKLRLKASELTPEAMVAALNEAPKPFTLVDFVRALPGPVALEMTTGGASPQAGARKKSSGCDTLPRTVLSLGDKVTATLTVADAKKRDAVFLSFKSRGGGRVYMELAFPLTGAVTTDGVMNRVKGKGDSLGCVSCHTKVDKKAPENSAWALAEKVEGDGGKMVPSDAIRDIEACFRREAANDEISDGAKRVMDENAARMAAIVEVGITP